MLAASTTTDALLTLPFALLLAAISVAPFINYHWWERHYAKVSIVLGAVSAAYYLGQKDYTRLLHVAHEYVGFLALIGSLYVVAGGIHIQVRGRASAAGNCVLLLVGAVLANVVGTTGASMLLIRPFLRLNEGRLQPFHVVFFIFIVSNAGGCLTPIGDPPLFLGFLKDVPFWWVFVHCWKAWLVAVGSLLAIFAWLDRRHGQKAAGTWRFEGLRNLAFLAIILAAVFVDQPPGLRETLMLGAAVCSYFLTPREIHEKNHFHFAPVEEVAWLFAGIFLTMTPVLDLLAAQAPGLGVDTPGKFFWLTGALSGVLDNAPTYLALLATAMGRQGLGVDQAGHMGTFLTGHGDELRAISLGAVFFGAMTYLGNGPNFMIRAIARQRGVQMPGFFAYVTRYAAPVLLPVFFAVWTLFFSRWRIW